jgi:hypothetical protein
MDPAAIATMAVTMLAPYLAEAGKVAANEIGQDAAGQVERLIDAIRRKFGTDQDGYAAETLARLEQQPAAEPRKRALTDVLTEKADADSAFKSELERLVAETRGSPAAMQFLTQVYGGSVEQILNVGQVGVMNFGRRDEPGRDDGAGRAAKP